jgi:hypothetical protein
MNALGLNPPRQTTTRRAAFAALALANLLLANPLLAPAALAQTAPPPANQSMVPEHIRQALPDARLAGKGQHSWFGLLIYDAALWVGKQGYAGHQAKEPFVLELRYARSLGGMRIAQASIEQMQKVGVGSSTQHASWLASMQATFPDVQEGTRLSAWFAPKAATRFFLNGKPLGEIADPEFGPAFAAIWLSSASTAPHLREALLRNATQPATAP